MADGLNRVMLLGNLGADPELKMTSGGQAVLKMRLATTETYYDRNKVKQERTEWHSIVLWGKRAEALAKFLSKGARLFVEGKIQSSSWEDKSGQKRYRTEINASNVILAGGKRDGGSAAAAPREDDGYDYGDSGDSDTLPAKGSAEDDEIPF